MQSSGNIVCYYNQSNDCSKGKWKGGSYAKCLNKTSIHLRSYDFYFIKSMEKKKITK